MKTNISLSLALIVGALSLSLHAASDTPPSPFGAVPTERQLVWQEMEFYGFCHFTVDTFTDLEWGLGSEPESVFNPTNFDADQIVQAFKSAGMTGIILTCKHHDGFCLWPSKFTEHSVKNSPWKDGKGDVVRAISDACQKYGLKFGIYLSPWDRNSALYGKPEYITYYRNQLRELLTNYGPIFEVWLDGANGGSGYYGGANETRTIDKKTYYDWPTTWKLIRELQPGAMIFSDAGPDCRWVGNERGVAGDPCWGTITADGWHPGDADKKLLNSGIRFGKQWIPAEADVSIRPGWFWHAAQNDQVRSVANLWNLYFESVGRGATMNLNVPPDSSGQIYKRDTKTLAEFGQLLKTTFAVNLAKSAKITASNVRGEDQKFSPQNLLDGNLKTYWATDDSVTNPEVTLEFKKPVTFNIVSIREFLPLGQRIGGYALDEWQDGKWVQFTTGTAIGINRLWRGENITTEKIRLRITDSPVCPALSEIGLFSFATMTVAIPAAAGNDYPVSPVAFTAVKLQDNFWSPRMEINRKTTLKTDFKKCEETGRIDNFAKAGGLMKGEFEGIPYNDSDVYKVIEGACYTLARHPDPELEQYLDGVIAKIAAAQKPDGYLYTARELVSPEKLPAMSGKERWSNVKNSHELYNVGHLYEAAVAHYQATGKKTLLDVATKNADLICSEFTTGKHQNPPGHEEIEIGLCKLYRATGKTKYLNLAKFLLDLRGHPETHQLYGDHYQDHKPVVEQDEAVGHAVRAGYLYSGMADVAALTGDKSYLKAIDKIWGNVVDKRLYLTGGIGARHSGEAFGEDYELPNETAYNETCAAVANALWNYRMFLLHGDAKYLDVLERVIYNGFLSGVSLTGDTFFYPNPLASHKGYERSPWFDCACCPVNVVRFMPSIAGYVYAVRDADVYVNLYIGGTGEIKLDKQVVNITQQTNYPWDGRIKLTIDPATSAEFALNLRIPGWAQGRPVPGKLYEYLDHAVDPVTLKVNGEDVALNLNKGFTSIKRVWHKGDIVELTLPMAIRRVVADEAVKDDAGRVALERGPIVYCIEGTDNEHVFSMVLDDKASLVAEKQDKLLGGVTVIKGGVQMAVEDGHGKTITKPATMLAIPYYAWCNRGSTEMNVWFARTADKAQPVPANPTTK